MPADNHVQALQAVLTLARQLTRAGMAIALIQRKANAVVPLRSDPSRNWQQGTAWRWQMPATQKQEAGRLQTLPLSCLPSMVAIDLPFPPAQAAYLDCTEWGEQVAGGLLLIWDAEQSAQVAANAGDAASQEQLVSLLRPIYARLLDGSHLAVQTVESEAKFNDVFNSVQQGIVVVSGQGAHAQVNQWASALLQIQPGSVSVETLARAMGEARRRCDNADELEFAYQVLQHSLDAEVTVDWELDERILRVDTHPVLNNGHNGRVWLFQDVTAQARLERMLRREASHDALTGLFNRRAFFNRAQAHYQAQATAPTHALDGGTPERLAVLMFDVDHFKQINDSFGHPVGDGVLKEVARRALNLLRDGDVLARYGGEEFILLIRETTDGASLAVAERLRKAMEGQPIQIDSKAIEVRISLGLALRCNTKEPLARTIERADRNLYQAKREGRNRVVHTAC